MATRRNRTSSGLDTARRYTRAPTSTARYRTNSRPCPGPPHEDEVEPYFFV